MNMIRYVLSRFLLATLGVVTASGCGHSPEWVRSLDAATSLSVSEGLPHQVREAALLEQEQQRTDTTMIGGFAFYTPPVTADRDQARRLKQVLGDGDRYASLSTRLPTDCGPFHPDYAVQWIDDAGTQQLLVCFTCGEVRRLSGSEQEEFHFGLMNELEAVLDEYASKRP